VIEDEVVIYRNILHLYLPTTNTLILFQEYIPVMLTVMEELLLLLIIVHIYKKLQKAIALPFLVQSVFKTPWRTLSQNG
jgi:type IV secretory pathway TrbL component